MATTTSTENGAAPYAWKISDGTLPPGLFLSASGTISGTPTKGGDLSLTLLVGDGSTPQKTATRVVGLVIEPETLTVTTKRLCF